MYTVGRVVRYTLDDDIFATCSNFVQKISLSENIDSDYLFYLFKAMYRLKVNGMYYNQTTGIQNLKVKEYLNQRVFLPRKEEQIKISSFLNKSCNDIDMAIDNCNKKLSLLRERRQIIITDVVTGKVRI